MISDNLYKIKIYFAINELSIKICGYSKYAVEGHNKLITVNINYFLQVQFSIEEKSKIKYKQPKYGVPGVK